MEFGVGGVEVGGEAEVALAGAVGAEGGDDVGVGEALVEGGDVGVGAMEGEDGAGVGVGGVGVEDLPPFGLKGGDEPGAFAEEFLADGVEADFEDEFEGGAETGEAEQAVGTGFVAAGVEAEGDFFLGDEVGAMDVVPAVGDGVEGVEAAGADVEEAGGAGAEEPFVGVGGEEVDVLDGGGEGAEGLDGVHAEEDVALGEFAADGVEFEAEAGDEVAGGEGYEAGVFINLAEDVDAADAPESAGVEEADFDAAVGEGHPRVNVGGVVVEVDQDVGAFAEGEAGGDHAEGEGRGADEGDFGGLGAEETGGEGAGVNEELGEGGFLIIAGALLGDGSNGIGDATGQGADAGVTEKDAFLNDGEFVAAQVFVGKEFGEGHGCGAGVSN